MTSYPKLCCQYFLAFSCQVIFSQYWYFHHDLIIKNTLKLIEEFQSLVKSETFRETSMSVDDS